MIAAIFPQMPIGSLVEKVSKAVEVQPKAVYHQIGIRSHGRGLFDKPPVTGTQLGNKRVFWIEPNCFVVNIVFAWEQAVGKTMPSDVGKIASHRFPMYRPKLGKVDIDFLTYLFKTKYGKELLGLASPGGAGRNKTLGQSEFLKIRIHVPPIAEQRRIAEILSTWDRAIAVQERLLANARAQKKALMQTLLTGTKKRLPGFKGEWKMKLFKHVVSIDQDSLGQNTPPDFEFRYISLSDVSSGSIANNLPSHTFSEAPSRARRKLKLGDILMATVRPNLQAFARVQSAQSDCIASTGFSVLSAKRDHSADYVYHYLFSEHITGQIDALVVGSSYPAINSTDVASLAIHCPEKTEQDAIAQVLNVSDETVISGETKLSLLKREKSALMQQLLTGKRRVKVEAVEPDLENQNPRLAKERSNGN